MKLDLTLEQFKIIKDAGLHIDEIYLLRLIEEGQSWKCPELAWPIRMSLGLLGLKEYLIDEKLTDKAYLLLGQLEVQVKVTKKEDSLSQWVGVVHEQLQKKLLTLTGRKQKMISGKYSFLCNKVDLEKKLRDVMKKYGELDLNRVQKALERHVDRSHRAGWDRVYLMEYYIMKEGVSRMFTDLDQEDGDDKEITARPLADPKNLF